MAEEVEAAEARGKVARVKAAAEEKTTRTPSRQLPLPSPSPIPYPNPSRPPRVPVPTIPSQLRQLRCPPKRKPRRPPSRPKKRLQRPPSRPQRRRRRFGRRRRTRCQSRGCPEGPAAEVPDAHPMTPPSPSASLLPPPTAACIRCPRMRRLWSGPRTTARLRSGQLSSPRRARAKREKRRRRPRPKRRQPRRPSHPARHRRRPPSHPRERTRSRRCPQRSRRRPRRRPQSLLLLRCWMTKTTLMRTGEWSNNNE
mmetsp:Transcript_16152/g.39386  ORF Transcript_16152/g.39386 Transcript_16152/m.39386 type:complete len:254 (+) Transcript_16152:149-910(+)